MTEMDRHTLPPAYFDRLYRADADPWHVVTSAHEDAKYTATLAALPRERYRSAFEIGCSIGVLTARLAPRCRALLAVDVSERALDHARRRCAQVPHVRFARMHVPAEYPIETFDLTVVSDVGTYWSRSDLVIAQRRITKHLAHGGHVVLVHWTTAAPDAPLSGDDVHDSFGTCRDLRHVLGWREARYRLDVFEHVLPA